MNLTDDFKMLLCFQFQAIQDAVRFKKSTADESVEDPRTNSL